MDRIKHTVDGKNPAPPDMYKTLCQQTSNAPWKYQKTAPI